VKYPQWIVIALALLGSLGLYFFGQRKPTNVDSAEGVSPHASAKSGMNPFEAKPKSNLNIEDSLEMFRQLLTDSQRDSLKILEKNFAESIPDKAIASEKLAKAWRSWRSPELASYYQMAFAQFKNDEDAWRLGADEAFIAMKMTPDTSWKNYFADKAIQGYEKTLSFAPANLDYKVTLAECFVEGKGAVMKGVTMLREVTAVDSTHTAANLLLGKLAISSSQFDKAAQRLEKLAAREPKNSEALYYLGEAYLGLGRNEEAVRVFEECKKIVGNPAFAKELDAYIRKNINKP